MRTDSSKQYPKTTSTKDRTYGSWFVHTRDGVGIHVPDRVSSITTFTLLEQGTWFEPEFDFVLRILRPEMHIFDIGANHGVYALSMTQHLSQGRVWAFEPTAEPRNRMRMSQRESLHGNRLQIMPFGFSDSSRDALIHVSENSELNSLTSTGHGVETVRLETIDHFIKDNLEGVGIDLVKLDAEGEEEKVIEGGRRFFSEQSPIVLFEVKNGSTVNLGLADVFRTFGFDIFQLLPELQMLVPAPRQELGTEALLNLFALKQPQQDRLAAEGLLVRSRDFLPGSWNFLHDEAAAGKYESLTGVRIRPTATEGHMAGYLRSISDVITCHLTDRCTPAERLARMVRAHDDLIARLKRDQILTLEEWLLLVHVLNATGRQLSAVGYAKNLLRSWPADCQLTLPWMTPLAADLSRPRTTPVGRWLHLLLGEFVEIRRHYSSYFSPSNTEYLESLLMNPDHRLEIEARYVLNKRRTGAVPDPNLVPGLLLGNSKYGKSVREFLL